MISQAFVLPCEAGMPGPFYLGPDQQLLRNPIKQGQYNAFRAKSKGRIGGKTVIGGTKLNRLNSEYYLDTTVRQ